MTTSTCNLVILLGTVSPAGVHLSFTPTLGRLAAFTLLLHGTRTTWGDPYELAMPCELTGTAARWSEALAPGDLVCLRGALAWRDTELGDDTGRLVVVGTALSVVGKGEEITC